MSSSTSTCLIHRDRRADAVLGSRAYCASCSQEIASAARGAPPGVAPRECFAAQLPGGAWRALSGSGAAHWLAHELQPRVLPAQPRCAAGSLVRRADLLLGRRELLRELPQPRDLWVDLDADGCGLVLQSRRGAGDEVELSIRGLIGPNAALATVDFYRDLAGRGRFFR